MKLGFLTGDPADLSKAQELGFAGIELHVEAFGNPSTGALDHNQIIAAKQQMADTDVAITALSYYGCAFSGLTTAEYLPTYQRVFDAAEQLGIPVIASMSGFDATLDWDGNLDLWATRFGPIADEAASRGLKIAFENWMGMGGRLPHKPINFGGCPGLWKQWFERLPSPALGLEFDPSHLYWQGIDHIRALKEFQDRVYHVHAKDTEMLPEAQYEWGINANSFRFRIPGYGAINWAEFISTLDEIGYDGGVAIEHEDPIYSGERFDEGLERGLHVLDPLVR